MKRASIRIAALALILVALVAFDFALTGGEVLAGVGQYGRHGGS